MDSIVSSMKLAELKQRDLGKAYKHLESQASNLLCLSLKWKDLEEHYDSTRKAMCSLFEEIEARERVISLKEEQLVSLNKSISECSEELAAKERELCVARGLAEKCNEEVRLKDAELALANERVCRVLEKIELKERDLNLVSRKVEDCGKEIEAKTDVLCITKKRIEDSEKELELKQKALARIAELIEDRSNDLILKDKQVVAVKTLIEECNEELQFKEKETEAKADVLCTIKKRIEDSEKELGWKERALARIADSTKDRSTNLIVKEKMVVALKTSIEKCNGELQSKEKEIKTKTDVLSTIKQQIEDSEKERELKLKDLARIAESIKDLSNDLILKEKQVVAVKTLIEKCNEELQSKEKLYDTIHTQIEELSALLKLKEMELESIEIRIAAMCEEKRLGYIDSNIKKPAKKLDSSELFNKCRADFELEIKNSELPKDSFHKQFNILLETEKQLRNRVIELEEKEKKFDLVRNIASIPFSEGTKYSETKDGDELVRNLCEYLKMHDSIRMEVSQVLQASSFPAKMVLDGMRWFYPSNMRIGDMEYDGNLTKRSCVILLAALLRIPVQIPAPLKSEALKMANEWKALMKSTNTEPLEALGFLHLLANYGLASFFNLEELQSLLNSLSDSSQAAYLRHALGIVAVSPKKEPSTKSGHDLMPHEISATLSTSLDPAKLVLFVFQGYISQQWRKEKSNIEECVAKSSLLEQLAKISHNIDHHIKKDAMNLANEWIAKMSSQLEDSFVIFLRFVATYGLISSFKKAEILKFFEIVVLHKEAPELFQLLGLTHQIFDDLIQYLISSHQVLKAIRVASAFKLADKFVRILKDYTVSVRSFTRRERSRKHSTEERVALLNREITALTDVIQCITDLNLESKFPTSNLRSRILVLESMKDTPGYFEGGPSTKTALPTKGDKKPANDTFVPKSKKVAILTKSKEQKQPEVEPTNVHFTNNPPYKQGTHKRQRTIVGPSTYLEFPQVGDRNSKI